MASFTEQAAARDLLAVIHRDGGHHREEHGIKSYKMAEAVVLELRQASEGIPADDLLYVLELVQKYCKDTMSGEYQLEPGEEPLQKIYDIINIGKLGGIRRQSEEVGG